MRIKDIDVEVEPIYKPNNKNIYFKYKNNKLVVSVNTKRDFNNIENLILKNEDEIYKFLSRAIKNDSNQKSNSIHFFGKEYSLKIIKDYSFYINVTNDTFEIHTNIDSKRQIESILYDFYYNELKKYIDSIIDECIYDFKDVRKRYIFNEPPRLEYKLAKTFFGKCYTTRNKIVLNILLAKYDKIYIKSVLYHEFCHFSVAAHDEMFYSLYEWKFKNAREIQHNLRQIKYNDLY